MKKDKAIKATDGLFDIQCGNCATISISECEDEGYYVPIKELNKTNFLSSPAPPKECYSCHRQFHEKLLRTVYYLNKVSSLFNSP